MGLLRRIVTRHAQMLAQDLRLVADELEALAPGPPVAGALMFIHEGRVEMASIEVQDDHAPLTGRVTFRDAKGAETPPDTLPAWTSSDETVATVEAAEDGLTATVTIGLPGVTLIDVVTTETNTGAEIHAQGTITVQPGDTVIGEVTFE